MLFFLWYFNFLQKQNVWEKSVELWSKNLWTNQNAGFFNLEDLANHLRYGADFLDMTRGP